MIFVQMYIKILRFGQKSILIRGELFEIFMSETSEICLFVNISLVSDVFLELLRHFKYNFTLPPSAPSLRY